MKQCIKVYMVFMFVIISPFSLSIKTIPLDSLIKFGWYVIDAISDSIGSPAADASHGLSDSENDCDVLREDDEDDPETLKRDITELEERKKSGIYTEEKDLKIIFYNLLYAVSEHEIPIDDGYKDYIPVDEQESFPFDNIRFVPLP